MLSPFTARLHEENSSLLRDCQHERIKEKCWQLRWCLLFFKSLHGGCDGQNHFLFTRLQFEWDSTVCCLLKVWENFSSFKSWHILKQLQHCNFLLLLKSKLPFSLITFCFSQLFRVDNLKVKSFLIYQRKILQLWETLVVPVLVIYYVFSRDRPVWIF